jgi:acyl-CoA synthetase (AMP-forming)/AMP-acid ligase II
MTDAELAAVVTPLSSPVLLASPEHRELAEQVAHRTGRRVAVFAGAEPSDRALTAGPDDIAIVLHTSGTTGRPKPVPMCQWRLAERVRVHSTMFGLGPDAFYGGSSPYHHIAGLGNIAVALGVGTRITGLARFTVEGWCLLRELGITHTNVVPAMLEMVLAAGQAPMPTLQALVYGGASIRPGTVRELHTALPGTRLLNFFGQTEGSPLTVLNAQDHREAVRDRPELLLSVGRAALGVELAVAQPGDDGVGEVLARGDHVFHRDGEGWLHTGDVGRIDGEGYLYLSGRRNDMIIRGGENVHPLEVELAVAEHPDVQDVAVVGAADERLGQTVVAFVVPADLAAPPDPAALQAFTRARLSGFKVPVRWHFVADLPRNPSGKVLRRKLSEPSQVRT